MTTTPSKDSFGLVLVTSFVRVGLLFRASVITLEVEAKGANPGVMYANSIETIYKIPLKASS